jgi:hypothetical protein
MLPVPVLMLTGAAKYRFAPARTVVLAMLAFYCLSHALSPTVVDRLVKPEVKLNAPGHMAGVRTGAASPAGFTIGSIVLWH